jgi:hypothetical protein
VRYAVIINVPGLPVPVELRWAPQAAGAIGGYDPFDLAVDSVDALQAWINHLDGLGVEHSPVISAGAGHLMVLSDPDGIFIRIAEVPAGGVADITMPDGDPEPNDRWLKPPSMQHP